MPVSAQPPGTGRSAGHKEYCSSSLISTLNRASGDSKSKVVVRKCSSLPREDNHVLLSHAAGPYSKCLCQEARIAVAGRRLSIFQLRSTAPSHQLHVTAGSCDSV